jgi:hypothetical protein
VFYAFDFISLIKQKGIYTTYTQHIKGIYDTYIKEPIYAVAQKTNFGLYLLQASFIQGEQMREVVSLST